MHTADAIVLLGCRIGPAGKPSKAAARRAAAAASGYLTGVAPRIIASGGRRWGSHVEAEALAASLVAAGVPASAITCERWSFTTYENAIFSAELLRRMGARNAAIVTCPWHMARALADFRAVGVDGIPLPAPTASASIVSRAYRRAHEAVCLRLDAWAIARARLLQESARTTLGVA